MTGRALPIRSADNARLKAVRALRAGRDRDHLLLEGRHVIEEALAADLPLHWLLCNEETLDADAALAALAARALAAGAEVLPCAPALLREGGDLDSAADVLAWADRPACDLTALMTGLRPGQWLMVAAGVQEPGNVGALARVAAALGAAGFVTTLGAASPWHPRALRGASGTSLRLPVAERAEALELVLAARAAGAQVWAAATAGDDLRAVASDWQKAGSPPALLVLGEEGRGLPEDLMAAASRRVGIPLARAVDSLNVATAGAVLAWELFARGTPR